MADWKYVAGGLAAILLISLISIAVTICVICLCWKTFSRWHSRLPCADEPPNNQPLRMVSRGSSPVFSQRTQVSRGSSPVFSERTQERPGNVPECPRPGRQYSRALTNAELLCRDIAQEKKEYKVTFQTTDRGNVY